MHLIYKNDQYQNQIGTTSLLHQLFAWIIVYCFE